jgi:diguanylate cyclase (GGDEF)-like protein
MLAHVATALLIDAGVFDARYGEAGDALGLAAAMLISGLAMAMGPARGQRIAGLAMLCYLPGFAIVIVTTVTGIASSQLALVPMLADQVLLAMLHLGLLAIPFDEAQARLRQAALRDPLTGVWNRAGLAEQKSRLWAREAGVLAIDVDNFKTVNDRHGHAEGDRVLVAIAQEAARLATASDGIVARTGGDEFVMLLPGGEAELTRVATALLASLRSTQAPPATWSLSLGLAVVAEGEGDFEPALQRADAALYRAKDGGRDRLAA